MTLTQLQYFIAAAETNSFTRAAAQAGVTQSTISSEIAVLESTCGVGKRLFIRRSGNGIARTTLTPAGQALLPLAKAIIDTMHAALVAVARAQDHP